MSFPAYPSYQDSGVEWLGEVPSHWEVAPLKRLLDIRNGADHKHVEQEDGYPVIGSGGQFTWASDYLFDGESVLLGRKGTIDKPLYVTGRFWTVDTMYWSKIRSETSGHFAFYTATTIPFSYYSTNTALPSMTLTALNGHLVARPPFAEQVAIAAFLDRETAKIDALIEEQRRLIVLLKEKRQAVISHAVTKGLDPHAPMKDSGIEWLGEVPVHWTVAPLKRTATVLAGYAFSANAFSHNGDNSKLLRGINLSASGIRWNKDTVFWERSEGDGLSAWELRAGDVVLGMDRPWIGDGLRVAKITEADLPCMLLQRVAAVRADCPAAQRFILHCLRHEAFFHHCAPEMTGVSVPHISGGQIEEFRMPLPPAAEMDAIAAHIDARSNEFAALVSASQSAIELLGERRAALISAAVTGKIDVRGSADIVSFPMERARARGLVGTEIIERSASQPTFGRVKFQKMAFLAEGHVGISELAGCYTRAAAGPLDGALIEDMERGARSIAGIAVDQAGGTGTTVTYRLGQQRGSHRQELADWLGPDRTAKLDKLIADFADLNTKQAEAVATLYGVWNDLLSESASPSDDEIITGFLNDWHPKKREKFRASELPEWLGWMRRHGIVPTGSGPKTVTGRLFV